MSAIKLKENLYSVGVLNPSLRVFDIVMEARYGTSYNAYLITGEKNVLVETVEANFFDEYLDNIQSVVDISKIDYLIMNHTEPDHSGSVAKLLEKNPNITVVCTTAAQKYLRAIANHDFPCIVAKHGDKLDIGGQELEFIVAPLLHWPDPCSLGCRSRRFCSPATSSAHISASPPCWTAISTIRSSISAK